MSKKDKSKDEHKNGEEKFSAYAEYEARLIVAQNRLLAIQQAYLKQGRRSVIVLEGSDAAGKGGSIRRLIEKLDPRFCKVWPIGAPNEWERGQHYLERFWSRLPQPGMISLFDRSWYGRVLVERAEELTPKAVWSRAYDEINAFEKMLTDDGVRLIKMFLKISPEVQRERLIERMKDPMKRWKITARDFESRQFDAAYAKAEKEMFARTDTGEAPWKVISGNFKWMTRVLVTEHVVERLSKGVDLTPPPLDPEIRRLAREVMGIEVP
jgi:polyphosphate kinase 2 (PPK2 family)